MAGKAYRITYATEYRHERFGEDLRLVVIEWLKSDGSVKEYSRSFQTKDSNSIVWSHYYQTQNGALNDLKKTMREDSAMWVGKKVRELKKTTVQWI